MAKKKVKFLVGQGTNHGNFKAGDEVTLPSDVADLYVQRGIAENIQDIDPIVSIEPKPENINITLTTRDSEGNIIPKLSSPMIESKSVRKRKEYSRRTSRKGKNRYPFGGSDK